MSDLASVETYAANHLDEEIDWAVPAPGDASADEDWVRAANRLDEEFGQAVPAPGDATSSPYPLPQGGEGRVRGAGEDWVHASFVKVAEQVLHKIKDQPGVNQQSVSMLTRYYHEKTKGWQRNWGYLGCRFPAPTDQNRAPGEIVLHCLKLHAREILCELVADSTGLDMANLAQEPKDRETVQQALRRLDDMAKQAELLCQRIGGVLK